MFGVVTSHDMEYNISKIQLKIIYIYIYILQKHRSRDFTFLFFKHKLKLKSIYIFGESCSSCYTEHSKIGFSIFGFFYDF
jgi:hypothetical protein